VSAARRSSQPHSEPQDRKRERDRGQSAFCVPINHFSPPPHPMNRSPSSWSKPFPILDHPHHMGQRPEFLRQGMLGHWYIQTDPLSAFLAPNDQPDAGGGRESAPRAEMEPNSAKAAGHCEAGLRCLLRELVRASSVSIPGWPQATSPRFVRPTRISTDLRGLTGTESSQTPRWRKRIRTSVPPRRSSSLGGPLGSLSVTGNFGAGSGSGALKKGSR
jgi:hypothetical protein